MPFELIIEQFHFDLQLLYNTYINTCRVLKYANVVRVCELPGKYTALLLN